MPTYQYACTACGHALEAVQSFTDDPLTQCPQCEGRLRKLFGSVGVVFKGPGFYRTDSRASSNGAGKRKGDEGGTGDSGKSSDSGGKAADGGKSADSTSAGKTDSKPAKTSATSNSSAA